MNIQDLNNLANDIAVARLSIEEATKTRDEIIAKNKEIQKLEQIIERETEARNDAQKKLLEAMRENDLKSWKTEQANYSRAIRKTAVLDPIYKKQVEDKLKKGLEVKNWELKETEYISIRLQKNE